MDYLNYLYFALFAFLVYFVTKVFFSILFRGFSPFISSRPWVVKQILDEVEKMNINNFPKFKVYSFGCGRSGFLHALEKKYPKAELIGLEKHLFPFLIAKAQNFFRKTKIKVRKSRHFHRVDVGDADLIYSHIYSLETLRELSEKFKFECKPGTIIISNGFILPNLTPIKTLELQPGDGRFAFLSSNRQFFFSHKQSKKENKVYLFII